MAERSVPGMRARIPQDVDLEDRLIYGLTPVRFGYLVIAVLGALSLWRLEVLPAILRGAGCALQLVAGASAAWLRWRGRPLDQLVLDIAIFTWRNRRRAGRRGDGEIDLSAIVQLGSDRRP
jgi:hypothetical protein